jgi:hypothetical protein
MSDIADISATSREFLEKQLKEIEKLRDQHIAALAALNGHLPPESQRTPRRFIKQSGKPVRPIEAIETLLSEHGEGMLTGTLYELMRAGGCFDAKRNPPSAFKLSVSSNVGLGKIVQLDARGKKLTKEELKRIKQPTAIFSGTTKLR